MEIAGRWDECDDGVQRPIVSIAVEDESRHGFAEDFLVDTGADFTVLSNSALARINSNHQIDTDSGFVSGIGGHAQTVAVDAVLAVSNSTGQTARFHSTFAAFCEIEASEISILGRDILDHFDVIISRRTDQVLLLFASSRFSIHSG